MASTTRKIASSPPLSLSKSGLQLEVLALYRAALRVAVKKDRSSSSSVAAVSSSVSSASSTSPSPNDPPVSKLLVDASSTTYNAKHEFRNQASQIPKKDYRSIEHYIRQGYKKLKTLQMTNNTGFVSVSGSRKIGGGDGSGIGSTKRNYHSMTAAALPPRFNSSFTMDLGTRRHFCNPWTLSPLLSSSFPKNHVTVSRLSPLFTLTSSFSTKSSSNSSFSSMLLPRLKQGSTLSFRTKDDGKNDLDKMSSLPKSFPPCHITITSQWRDDGDVTWSFDNNDIPPKLIVQDKHEHLTTSLGREEPLVSLMFESDDSHMCSEDSRTSTMLTSPIQMSLNVPEKVNLDLDLGHGAGGSITIKGKIEGDIRLRTCKGNIIATKLRGHKIDIETQYGTVYVSDLLESQDLTIKIPGGRVISGTSNRVRAKRIQTNNMTICVGSSNDDGDDDLRTTSTTGDEEGVVQTDSDDSGAIIDISSLYVLGDANILVMTSCQEFGRNDDDISHRQAVRVKSHHGHVNVETNSPCPTNRNAMTDEDIPVVDLGGVNGSCEISIISPPEALQNGDNNTKSCHVHFDSIVPDSVSLIESEWGGVHVTADRKVETDVRLLSFGSMNEEIMSMVDVDTLILEDDDANDEDDNTDRSLADELVRMLQDIDEAATPITENPGRIHIETKAFTERRQPQLSSTRPFEKIEFIDGWIENKSAEPDSRFDRKLRGSATSLGGGVGKIRLDGAQEQALHSFDKSSSSSSSSSTKKGSNFARPLLAVCAPGAIRLETLSWLGNIARRYGLDDKRDQDDLGRQATRRGRL